MRRKPNSPSHFSRATRNSKWQGELLPGEKLKSLEGETPPEQQPIQALSIEAPTRALKATNSDEINCKDSMRHEDEKSPTQGTIVGVSLPSSSISLSNSAPNRAGRKLFSSASKRRAHLLKPYPKHFARERTSFLNSWSIIANLDLLEAYCIKFQLLGLFPSRSDPPTFNCSSFNHSEFRILGSNINFVRGLLSINQVTKSSRPIDSNEESVISASSEEIEEFEGDENQGKGDSSEDYGKDLGQLFQEDNIQVTDISKVASLKPIDKEVIPQNLKSFLGDCSIILG